MPVGRHVARVRLECIFFNHLQNAVSRRLEGRPGGIDLTLGFPIPFLDDVSG